MTIPRHSAFIPAKGPFTGRTGSDIGLSRNRHILSARRPSNAYNTRGRVYATISHETKSSVSEAFSKEEWDRACDNVENLDEAWQGLRRVLPHQVLRKLLKPGQYLGNELGAIRKDWDTPEVKVRFVLAYPDLYSIGMSSTGHVVLYSCLNEPANLLCDRAYLPLPDMQDALLAAGQSLFAVESKRPLTDFHVIGMSISYELTATNCLKMLDLSKIPLTWAERDSCTASSRFLDGPPLVFAGGLSVTANPEPYTAFFDFFSLGDGENVLPAIGQKIAQVLEENPDVSREEITLAIARDVPGVYAPRFYDMEPIYGSVRPNRDDVPKRPQRQNADPQPWRAMALVPHTDAVHDRLSVEVRRGCTRGCRFCLPGMVQRPARDVEPNVVMDAVKQGIEKTGYNEFSLLSLSCSDWLSLPAVGLQMKNDLSDHNISLSLGSQRVDRFDKNIASVAGGLRRSGLTFAPEAGSQRMRDVINKGLTDDDLVRGVRTAYEQGWQSVKLYFLIGLPGETDDDVIAIARTVKQLQEKCRAPRRRRLAVNVTISSLTPKPWTPFQWHSVSQSEFARKQGLLKAEFQYCRDVKVNYTDMRLSSMEEFIGRGDRRLSRVIRRAYELGAGMDAWWEAMEKAYDSWCQAIEDCGLTWRYRQLERGEWNIIETPTQIVRGKKGWRDVAQAGNLDRKSLVPKNPDSELELSSPLDRPLPWDHIDVGLDKGWLRDELMHALSETLTPDCAFSECSLCGVCGADMGNNVTIQPPPIPEYHGAVAPNTLRMQRIRLGFKRRGSSALMSHLDLLRMLDRLLRRASLPISYDGGFHPHPRIVPAAALPFGATADNEFVDFFLWRSVAASDFAARVGAELPSGMSVASCLEVPVVASSASVLMEWADYTLAIYRDCDATELDKSAYNWDDVLSRVLRSGPVKVEHKTKRGKEETRDLRSMLLSLRTASADERIEVLEHVGVGDWPVQGAVVSARLLLQNQGALSPEGFIRLLQVVMADDRITLLHAHRRCIYLREDEKYQHILNKQAFEASRRAMKPKQNQWARILMAFPHYVTGQ